MALSRRARTLHPPHTLPPVEELVPRTGRRRGDCARRSSRTAPARGPGRRRHHVARTVRRIGEPSRAPPFPRVPGVGLHHQVRLITPACRSRTGVLGWRQPHPIDVTRARPGSAAQRRAHARPQPPEPDLGPGKHRLGRQVENTSYGSTSIAAPLNRLILGQIRHPASLTRSLVVASVGTWDWLPAFGRVTSVFARPGRR